MSAFRSGLTVELAAMFVAGSGVVEVFGVAVSSVSPAIGQMKPA